ncbi:PaaI family thioesterase [Caballeronia sp. LZ024]|uniref:PaaI family thioesterase n=1 Tax=Caballeronia sp. LZ024 TaxID=3038561 RepID=UPI002864734D|nr:PaaI family thioesterase [Caballeronia sp. LZ024]MDR5752442.1 PaaI family thioesterase [Caballeronia sp. LZ024]
MNAHVTQQPLRIESSFCIDHGFELIEYGDGWAILACDVQSRHVNRHGNAHGGLVAALLDTSMGLAARTNRRVENLGTASLTVNYLKPASGRIAVHAHLRRCGRTLAFCEAEARNGDDDVVATASAVFAVSPIAQ